LRGKIGTLRNELEAALVSPTTVAKQAEARARPTGRRSTRGDNAPPLASARDSRVRVRVHRRPRNGQLVHSATFTDADSAICLAPTWKLRAQQDRNADHGGLIIVFGIFVAARVCGAIFRSPPSR
jgi:hypothetical protein